MPGTVILTGANGSSGLHAAAHLLHTYPDFTALLTVRSAASTDANTNTLRATISRFPASKASIHEVDLADLSAVHNFTTFVSSSIAQGELPPLQSNPLQRVLLGPRFLPGAHRRRARQDDFPRFSHITAVAINPGDSADSRVFQTNTLAWIRIVVAYILVPIRPLYRLLVDPTWRPSSEAGVDIVELAVNHDK